MSVVQQHLVKFHVRAPVPLPEKKEPKAAVSVWLILLRLQPHGRS